MRAMVDRTGCNRNVFTGDGVYGRDRLPTGGKPTTQQPPVSLSAGDSSKCVTLCGLSVQPPLALAADGQPNGIFGVRPSACGSSKPAGIWRRQHARRCVRNWVVQARVGLSAVSGRARRRSLTPSVSCIGRVVAQIERVAVESKLDMFKLVGFFEEREGITSHLQDFYVVTNEGEVQACIMFGTLLGKQRHDDFIPWDDDVDIVIFDFDAFLQRCVLGLEQNGYIVEPDIRDGKRMGCRIFHQNNRKIPNRPALRFPWIGIWEHEVDDEGLIVLPPEDVRYEPADFLPLGRADFLGTSVGIPQNPVNILNTYFASDDWMECCVLPERDHRKGGQFTNFPQDKFRLQDVLAHLSRSGERDLKAARR
jgi:hypothetical protein